MVGGDAETLKDNQIKVLPGLSEELVLVVYIELIDSCYFGYT